MTTGGGHPGSRRPPPSATAAAALAGVLAGGLALGVAELLAALVSPTSSPLVAVGGAFVDRTPPWLKDAAVSAFGTRDKLVLLVGAGLTVGALSAFAGVVGRRWWPAGAALVVGLGAVAAAAAATRAGAGQLDAAPSLLGAVAGLVALRLLLARVPDAVPAAEPGGGSPAAVPAADRRTFLLAAGATLAVAAASAAGGRLLGAAARGVSAARAALRLPAPSRPAAALPAGVTVDVDGMTPFVTPNADFYRIDTALALPQVDASTWTLRVHGLVEQQVELSFDDLLGADLVEAWVTLTCVSNEVGGDLVGNAKWLGLPVREVLARARPLPAADMVLSTSADGFTASTPLPVLTDDRDALLAVGMNGEPLPVRHGYPVRMVVPGLYGYVSATKWVVDLEVTRFADRSAYWTDRGWSERGPVKTMSRIDVPRGGSLQSGPVVLAGVAWAQQRGITSVEVKIDDGDWVEADLAEEASVDTWRQWSLRWDARPGTRTVVVRATDGDGNRQESSPAPPVPDGATGLHSRVYRVG